MGRYSRKMYDAVAKADMSMLGVQLGAACVDAQVPVQVVARWMGVTRQGVYYWFTGVTDIADDKQDKAEQIIQVLTKALDEGKLPAASLDDTLAVVKQYRGNHASS